MKQFFILWVVLAVCQDVYAQKEERRSVKDTFLNYKKSILATDGQEAVKWVDMNTINYYGKMLGITLNADSTQVASLTLMDKLTVLSLRHRVPKKDIVDLDGRQLFIYSIDQGMVGKNSVANLDIGEVTIDGDAARGQLLANGQQSPLYFQFNMEGGR